VRLEELSWECEALKAPAASAPPPPPREGPSDSAGTMQKETGWNRR
jgi:hypothetical protein